MRFQKGVRFSYYRRPRGPGRRDPPYRMSLKACQARIHAAGCRKRVGGKRPRTWEETRRIELEIALGTHRGENYRAMAKRLGCSPAHCCRVACKYRRGLIPMLPRDEQGLLALRDSVGPAPTHDSDGVPLSAAANIAHTERECRERLREAHEWRRKNPSCCGGEPCTMQEWQELERRSRRGGWFRW